MSVAVALRNITKHFGDVVAIDDASLEVEQGEIHALLGENGAGKTSLMNVLAGLYRPDSGDIALRGQAVQVHSPEDAKRLGIGMVHQEQRLVARYTAVENVSLGHRQPAWLLPEGFFRRLAARLSERYGLAIDHINPVWNLPIGRRQRVELIKLLHHGAELIILDEPTANLAPAEVETFFGAVRQLTTNGHTVILITHKLDEVIRYADRVTIMRAGRVVATFPTSETSRERLNQLMVGVTDPLGEGVAVATGPAVLSVRGLSVEDVSQRINLYGVDLDVRGGELVAIAGVAGNGQSQLAEAITGHIEHYDGTIALGGRDIRGLGPRTLASLGVAYVPEDRRAVGLIGGQSVAINLALRRYDRPPFSTHGWLDYGRVRAAAVELIERYGIRPPDPDMPVGRLSGGNQQRVIIAREFSGNPRLIVADNFTRGLDPRSTQQFTHELFAHRDRGAAVVWITGDLGEALVCDRIAVMNSGHIVAVLERAEATRERVGLLMSGDLPPATPESRSNPSEGSDESQASSDRIAGSDKSEVRGDRGRTFESSQATGGRPEAAGKSEAVSDQPSGSDESEVRGDRGRTFESSQAGGDRSVAAHESETAGDRARTFDSSQAAGDRSEVAGESEASGDRTSGSDESKVGSDRGGTFESPQAAGDRSVAASKSEAVGDRAKSALGPEAGGDRTGSPDEWEVGSDRDRTFESSQAGGDRSVAAREAEAGGEDP